MDHEELGASAPWNPNDYQGRTQEQVEGDIQVGVWVGGTAIVFIVAAILVGIGKWLVSLVTGL